MITAITPTGDRPLAFALCQNWVKNQTVQPDQWIVVDDGIAPLQQFIPMDYIRREPQPGELKPTLLINLKTAIPAITGDKIIILEDDEYYAPTYIEELSKRLDSHEVVGVGRSKYYHLPSGGYTVIGNMTHASLAQTSFRSSFLPKFVSLLVGNMYLDMRLWKLAGKYKHLFVDSGTPLYLGIKGLPGRGGVGAGHNPKIYRVKDTADRGVLKQWIPGDFQIYLDILDGKLTKDNYREYFGW